MTCKCYQISSICFGTRFCEFCLLLCSNSLSIYIYVVISCTFIDFPLSILFLLLLFVCNLSIYVHSKIKLIVFCFRSAFRLCSINHWFRNELYISELIRLCQCWSILSILISLFNLNSDFWFRYSSQPLSRLVVLRNSVIVSLKNAFLMHIHVPRDLVQFKIKKRKSLKSIT